MTTGALTGRPAAAAARTAARRPADPPALRSDVADAASWCRKPWATVGAGTVTEVCERRPAHRRGPCGPDMSTPQPTARRCLSELSRGVGESSSPSVPRGSGQRRGRRAIQRP